MEHNNILLKIEAILFCSPEPVEFSKLCNMFKEVPQEELKSIIQQLMQKYSAPDFSFELVEYENQKYCFVTKKEYSQVIKKFFNIEENIKLNRGVLETLAIIAYKGPVTKSEIDLIRGVNSAGAIDSLLEKELIAIVGKKEVPGKPLLYGVTDKFFRILGIKNISELPPLEN